MPEQTNQIGLNNAVPMRTPTLEEERARLVQPIKDFRKQIDHMINRVSRPITPDSIIPNEYRTHEAVDQVRINLTNAKMWSGKILEFLGNPFPTELADNADNKAKVQ